MQYRAIGTTDLKASVVGLGTWAIGGGSWWGESDDKASIKTIHAALDLGVNLIDTAPMYGFGRSETVVGRAIHDRREKVVLATKCGLWWKDQRGTEWFTLEGTTVRRSLRPDTVRKELEDSLRRLDTDRIDLYQTHWPALEAEPTPIQDTMATLLAMKAEGKIRAIGASNVHVDQVRQYQQVGPLDAVQPRYSILDRAIEKELLPHCRSARVASLVYSPLEQGLLTGAIGMDRVLRPEEYRARLPWLRPANRGRVLELLSGWRDLTLRYDCTLAQLVIAWTVAQPGITSALCGARTPRQIEENAVAGKLAFQPDDLLRMRRDAEALGKPA